jgi:hypothetical protein
MIKYMFEGVFIAGMKGTTAYTVARDLESAKDNIVYRIITARKGSMSEFAEEKKRLKENIDLGWIKISIVPNKPPTEEPPSNPQTEFQFG